MDVKPLRVHWSRAVVVVVALLGGCDLVYSLDRPTGGWRDIAAGTLHTCGLARNGELFCWGGNTSGEVGVGDELSTIDEPRQVEGSWSQLATSYTFTCAIRTDATLWCWGVNSSGQLGNGSITNTRIPKQIEGAWRSVATGYFHACAIDRDDRLSCFGRGAEGQLGAGDLANHETPERVDTETWKSVTVGGLHTCGIRSDDTLWCWGDGGRVRLGDPALTGIVGAPAQIGSETWRQVSAFADGTCGITTRGALRCWGSNVARAAGQLTGTGYDEPTPVLIDGDDVTDWDQLESGYSTACALRSDGSAWCWGDNQRGQLGAEEPLVFEGPQRVVHPDDGRWTRVSVGTAHSCFIDSEARAYCTGGNGFGQLGVGGSSPRVPTKIADDWVSIDAGDRVTCAIDAQHRLACSGLSADGQIGVGDLRPQKTLGRFVNGEWSAVTSGVDHQCAIDVGGSAWCWGNDLFASLGNGAGRSDADQPTEVATAATFTSVDAGGSHTCSINAGRAAVCWGFSASGQIGDDSTALAEVPRTIALAQTPGDWRAISAGGTHSCGIPTLTGVPWCWGLNSTGQLGDGTTTDRKKPTIAKVRGRALGESTTPVFPVFTSISAGADHTCAVGEGQLWCWGGNDFGQLGVTTGFSTFAAAGYQVPGTDWERVAAGFYTTCAIKTDGSLWCWGDNARGQLGDGTLLVRLSPVRVEGEGWTHVTLGVDHTCGIRSDGTYCWGNNDDGAVPTGEAWRPSLREIVERSR